MKAATTASFGLDCKYERIAQLLLVYVWHANDPDQACAYALRYEEAKRIADQMGWTQTESWRRGKYATTRPSERLQALLTPYRMKAGHWRRKGQEAGTAGSRQAAGSTGGGLVAESRPNDSDSSPSRRPG
jgi:hypothetical protein